MKGIATTNLLRMTFGSIVTLHLESRVLNISQVLIESVTAVDLRMRFRSSAAAFRPLIWIPAYRLH